MSETPRAQIARIATTIADTQVWLAACPLRRADAFYETAEYTLQSLVEEIVEMANANGLGEIAESIAIAQEQGEYPDDDEVAFWRHIAGYAAGDADATY